MTAEYTGFLKVLFDWQTVLAGLLALAAGLLAYWAAQGQVRATKEQMRQSQREIKRQLASKVIIAASLLDQGNRTSE